MTEKESIYGISGETVDMLENGICKGTCRIIEKENIHINKVYLVAVAYKSSPMNRGKGVFSNLLLGIMKKGLS